MSKNKAKNVTATRTQNAGALAHVHVLRCLHGAGSPPANVSPRAPPLESDLIVYQLSERSLTPMKMSKRVTLLGSAGTAAAFSVT